MARNPKIAKKAVFYFDWHVPHEDKRTLRLAHAFQDDFKPDVVVMGGDGQNMDSAASFASAQESTIQLEDEYRRNEELLEWFGVTHYLEGNHEERIRRLGGQVDPRLRSLLDWRRNLHIKERGIRTFPYHNRRGVFKVGKLSVLHGFFTNQYASRKHAEAYGCCMFGHTHRHQIITPKQAFERNTGFNIGCLCNLDMPWTHTDGPKGWIQGFAFGYFFRSGNFSLYDVRIIGNDFVINGKYYGR